MNKLLTRLSILLFLSLGGTQAWAYVGLCCGKCGGNMPMNIPGGGVPETYEYRFKTSIMQMHMDGMRNGTESISTDSLLGMPAMGKYMAAPTEMDMNMLNFMTGYSFSDDFFAGVMFMYKQNSMDMKFNNMMQMNTGQNGFTMESEGIADTMLMAKYRLFTDDPLIPTSQASLFMGLSLPTGSIDEKNSNHPLAMRRGEQLPYAMQLGSGTFDPTIGFLYQGSKSPYWWGINTMYTARLHDNKRDYRLGNEFRLDLYSMFQISSSFLLQAQINARDIGRIKGEMDEAAAGTSGRSTKGNANSIYMTPMWETNNYGGREVMATVGFNGSQQPCTLSISVLVYRYTRRLMAQAWKSAIR